MFSSLNSSPTPSSSSLLPADRSKEPGKSMPMMDTFTDFSMVGVYENNGVIKFVHVKSEKFIGRFTILIFMDDKLSKMEIEEWKDFSNHIKDFKHAGASVVGVCTDSHISLRTMMMGSLQGVSFPIISDRDEDFSRAFGVLKVKNGKFGAARALVILDREGRMVHMTMHNENTTRSFPGKVVELIKKLQGEAGNVIETRVGDLGSKPTISDDSGSGSQVKNSSNVKTKDSSSISMSVFSKDSKATKDSNKGARSTLENTNNSSSSEVATAGEKIIDEEEKKTVDDKKPAEKKSSASSLSVCDEKPSEVKKHSKFVKPSDIKKPSDTPSTSIMSILSHPMLLTADAKKPSATKKGSTK